MAVMHLDFMDRPAEVQHLNIRKEGANDNRVLAVDVKLEIALHYDSLIAFDIELVQLLYTLSAGEWQVRFPRMGAISWSGEMPGMEIWLSGLTATSFFDVRLHRFEIEPAVVKGQRLFTLRCSASFRPQHARHVAQLAELVGETVLMACHKSADLLTPPAAS